MTPNEIPSSGRQRRMPLVLGLALIAALGAGCGGEERPSGSAGADEEPEDTVTRGPAEGRPAGSAGDPPPPDTTAAGLWRHLQGSDYRSAWWLWPGKGELYAGRQPHGPLLTTWTNFLARDALTNGASTLVPGAIVVKENHAPDGTLGSVTVMYKSRGYDPEHGDWFWARYRRDGEVEAAGRVESCIGCHEEAPHDYILTAELGTAEALGLEPDSVHGGGR